jgi:hypothetical protein
MVELERLVRKSENPQLNRMIEILKTDAADNYSVRRQVFYSPETTLWLKKKLSDVRPVFRSRYKYFLYEWHRHFPGGLSSVRASLESQAVAYTTEPGLSDELRARRLGAYCDLVEYVMKQTATLGFSIIDYGFSAFLDQHLDTKYGASVTEPRYLVALSVYLSDLCWQIGVDRRNFLHEQVQDYQAAKINGDTNKIWSCQETLPSIAVAVHGLMPCRPDHGEYQDTLAQHDLLIAGITSDQRVRYDYPRSFTNSVRIADVEASRTAVWNAARFFGRMPRTNLIETIDQIVPNERGFGKLIPEQVARTSTPYHRQRVSLGMGVEYQALVSLFSPNC